MKYECFIDPKWRCMDIEANSAQEARQIFCDMIVENIEPEHIEANNLDTDDGNDPTQK